MTYKVMPKVASFQKQIIVGTVLGGSSIVKQKKGKNCYLSMRGTNKSWIEYKALELGFISSPNPYTLQNNYWRWHSRCSPFLTELYPLFFDENNKRRVSMDTLDGLRDIGIAIWFLDCGSIKDKQIELDINCFGESMKTISQYFNEIGLENEIIKSKVQFNKPSSSKFVEVIGNQVPEFMYSKLYGMI